MEIKKKWKQLFLSMLMVFSALFVGINTVSAAELQKGSAVKYPAWLGKWSTKKCTIDGYVGYCLEASKDSPESGNYADVVISKNEELLKVLYYGYEGPGNILANRGLTNDEQYVCTHVMASYAYSRDLYKVTGWDTKAIQGRSLHEIYNEIISKPKPSNTFHFSKDSVNAYVDEKNSCQRTEAIRLNTSSSTSVVIPLQNGVTLHNVTKGTTGTGKVAVQGGDTFYLSASFSVTQDFNSGNIAGKNLKMYAPLVIEVPDPEQDEGYLTMVDDPTHISLRVKWVDVGNIELTKTNKNSDLIDGAVFNVSNVSTGYSKDVEVKDGKITISYLPVGTYNIREISAPEGYLIDNNIYTVQVETARTVHQTVENSEPTGTVELTKSIDNSNTNGLKGDAILEGNVYGLYAKEKITNKASTKVFYEKDSLVSSKTTDSNGKITWNDLPLGNYYIKETSANDSLVLNSSVINVSLEYEGQAVSKVTVSKKTADRVNMQKIQVFKSGEKDGISGFVKGLQGCEFTFKLKSEVDHVGWDNAQSYAIITTDANGIANTPYLPYGQYLVKETKTPEDHITAPDFTVSVTDDYLEYEDVEQIKRININNRPFTSQVRLIKVDQESGETVTLNSASFKIKDSKGNYVIQKVSGIKQDTFTTNSKNQIVSSGDKKGEVILPLELDAGTYTIEEIKVPEGFLQLEEPVTFTITNQYNYDTDEDETPILTVKVKNTQPKGKIILTKTDKVTAQPLENVEYELTAKEDIYSAVDGTLRYRKGATVAAGKTNASGRIVIDELFMGKYELKETLTNEGYVLSSEVHDIVFEQKDTVTKEYVINVDVTNIAPEGEIHLVKTDKDTRELLSGVTFQLTAKEDIYSLDGRNTLIYKVGQTVSMDPGDDGLYVTDESGEINIAGLPLGHYELREIQTLEGYVPNTKVYDVDLTYDHSDKVIYTKEITVKNEKTTTEISKIDATDGKELEGAHLTLKDRDGNIIEEWVSKKEPHIIRGLSVDQEYILHEDLAPIGYATASDVTFKVNSDGSTTKVIMKDEITKVDISKVDATTSKEIEGAKLTLTDKGTGQIIETWISMKEPHRIEGLETGKTYILHEDLAPIGYEIASDIEFTILDTGEVQRVVMKDQIKTVAVKTGDDADIISLALLLFGSGLLIVAVCYRIKRNRDE